jgi:hypothetical protein
MDNETKLNNIDKLLNNKIQEVTDGYHSFDELYYHRMILFLLICNQNKDKSWKSKLHHDKTMFDNYFIVGIETPDGQYTYHYHMQYWGYFKDVREIVTAPPWDGHKPNDIHRILSLYTYFKDIGDDNDG